MVGQAELLRRPGDVPFVPLERRHHDPPLRLGLELLERPPVGRGRPVGLAPDGSRPARGSAPITSPSAAMIIRSTTFRSSRTLFRRQS